MNASEPIPMAADADAEPLEALRLAVRRAGEVIVGKPHVIRLAVACLLARGHLLIEDIPGVGKTTLAHVLARVMGLAFQRVQFTSDLLPADVLGISVYERESGAFVFHPGPIFSQLLLADEVNRATPKTQSALLEAMEERQVTQDGETRPLPAPFFVIATQNPSRQVGTFPLPESQLDRFLMRVELGYPDRASERALLAGPDRREMAAGVEPAVDAPTLIALQGRVRDVRVSEALLDYVQAVIEYTRNAPGIDFGLSPRAGLGLVRSAQAWAMLEERAHVLPEDVQAVLGAVVGHRLRGVGDSLETPGAHLAERIVAEVPIPEGMAADVSAAVEQLAPDPVEEARGIRLGRRKVFIFATSHGVAYALVLGVMLVGSINYNNGLGFALTFLLASLALVSILHTWRNLAGLGVSAGDCAPVNAGATARFKLRVDNAGGPARQALLFRYDDGTAGERVVRFTIAPDSASRVDLPFDTRERGRLRLPRVTIATRYPIGLFRAWSYIDLGPECIVYPVPRGRDALPAGGEETRREGAAKGAGHDDFAGLRDYVPGDSPRLIHWKAVAREQGVPLKQFTGAGASELMLRWTDADLPDIESRLSQLAKWVVDAEDRGYRYGLDIPSVKLAPGAGPEHMHACLRALALFGEKAPPR